MTQDEALFALIAVMLIAGLVGGYAQYLSQPSTPAKEGDPPAPVHSLRLLVLLGLVAAGCVPLFLSLVQSKVVENVLKGGNVYQELLIFAGFCLVAAFSSRRFIDTVSNSVLRRLEQVEDKADDAGQKAEQAKKTAKEVAREVDSEAADDPAEPPPAEAIDVAELAGGSLEPASISPEDRKILEALTKRTYRTRTGIAEDSGIAKSRISELLEGMHERKLAMPTRSPSTGGHRWIITRRGEAALKGAG